MKTAPPEGGRHAGGKVGPLDAAVCLDDHCSRRAGADSFQPGTAAEQQTHDLAEDPDPGLPDRRFVPTVEHRGQPSAVGRTGARSWRGSRPVAVGQQKVHHRRGESEQFLIGLDRVVAQVDDGDESEEQVTVPIAAQGTQPLDDVGVAATAAVVAAVAVMGWFGAVKADPDHHVQLTKQFKGPLVEERAIGLDSELKGCGAANGSADSLNAVCDVVVAGQQRFTAMEDDLNIVQFVGGQILYKAVSDLIDGFDGHSGDTRAPPLVT